MMQQLQVMQQEIKALRPQSDAGRFRFDQPLGPSSARLDNGAVLTFSGAGEAARGPLALADTRGHETAHGSDRAPGTAAAGVEDAPAKKPRISVDAVSKCILEGAAGKEKKAEEKEEADGDAAAGPGAGYAAGTAPKSKKKAKAKVCPVRCQHDGVAKKFKCYWHKLNCKSFQYTSAKDKKNAQADANAWLQKTAERHGCKVPAITF